MMFAFDAALAAAATLAIWALARSAARDRSLRIGAFPWPAAVVAAAIGALSGAREGREPTASSMIVPIAVILVIATVTVAAVVDARCGSIFDPLTYLLATVGVSAALERVQATNSLLGGVVLGAALLALHGATARRGIGLGDVKFAAALGAALGLPAGVLALCAAFVLGGLYGAAILLTQRARRGATVPFAPFMAAGTYLAVLFPSLAR